MFGNSLLNQTGDQCEITEWLVKHGNVALINWLGDKTASRPEVQISEQAADEAAFVVELCCFCYGCKSCDRMLNCAFDSVQ